MHQNLVNFLKLFNNFDGEYVIRFGQARVIHGMSEKTRDCDIYVPPHIFKKYNYDRTAINMPAQGGFGKTLMINWLFQKTQFEIYSSDDFYQIDFQIVNGLQYVTRNQLLKDYEKLNRNKDKKWFNLITRS